MLDANEVAYRYREYRDDPLTPEEIREVLGQLGVSVRDVLRRSDKAYKALEWSGEEDDEEIIARMAAHPTLLQRPIGRLGGRAALGRPPEALLDLARG